MASAHPTVQYEAKRGDSTKIIMTQRAGSDEHKQLSRPRRRFSSAHPANRLVGSCWFKLSWVGLSVSAHFDCALMQCVMTFIIRIDICRTDEAIRLIVR